MSSGYDALLVLGFGGPESMTEVPGFLRRVSGGHIPQDRLDEVAGHYAHFGGVSPVNAQHRALAVELTRRLAAQGLGLPVACANRHAGELIPDVLARLAGQGAHRVLGLVAAPFASYSGCRAYREDLIAGLPTDTDLRITKIGCYPGMDALVGVQADLLERALRSQPGAHLVFTTHSIPTEMARTSGPAGNAYIHQHLRLIERVMAVLEERGLSPSWELAYQSRSGSPRTPWLEPDINDALARLADDGVRSVVCSPIGFLTDHMEVVWDLDIQATQTARTLGIDFTRVPTLGTQPAFLDALAGLVAAVLTGETTDRPGGWCGPGCCPNPRGPRPTVEGVTP